MDAERIKQKRIHEKIVVTQMIEIYCRGHKHENRDDWGAANCRNPGFGPDGQYKLCPECAALAEYSCLRTQVCPRMAVKTFCKNCCIHCYEEEQQAKIKEVMKYAGPRIVASHPVDGTYHLICSVNGKDKREVKKEKEKLAKQA